MSNLSKPFGVVIHWKRSAASLSQEAPSERTGLHRTYVGLLERGKRMPSILMAKQLAEALGATMSELLAEVDREPVSAKKREG